MHPIVIFDGIFFFFKSSKIRTWHDQRGRDVGHDGCVRTKSIRAGHESTSCKLPVDFEAIFLNFFTFGFIVVIVLFRFFCSGSIPSIPFRGNAMLLVGLTCRQILSYNSLLRSHGHTG